MSQSSECENKQPSQKNKLHLQEQLQQHPENQLEPTLMRNCETFYRSLTYPENEFGAAFDRCCTDAIIKGFCGTIIGAMFSAIVFRRRSWPVYMGAGFGLGLAYRGCEKYIESTNQDNNT